MYLAVAIFNHGRAATIPRMLRSMHCDVGSLTLKGMEVADAGRLYHAARKSSDVEKKAGRRKGPRRRVSRTRLLMPRKLHTVQVVFRVLIFMFFLRCRLRRVTNLDIL